MIKILTCICGSAHLLHGGTSPDASTGDVSSSAGSSGSTRPDTSAAPRIASTLVITGVTSHCSRSRCFSYERPFIITITFLNSNDNDDEIFCLIIAMAFVPMNVEAHNWIASPSRATQASVTVPCQRKVDGQPHVQVVPGQLFQTDSQLDMVIHVKNIIMLLLDDYDNLLTITEADIWIHISMKHLPLQIQ
jgi:hypothetical protein